MSNRIQVRRDTAANWLRVNPVLAEGEWGYETDTKKVKMGDGNSIWTSLEYYSAGSGGSGSGLTDEQILILSRTSGTNTGDQDLSGLMLKTATTAEIASSTNRRYVTDADITKLDNLSGTNTGDQDITAMVHSNRTALDLVSGTNTGDQDLSGLMLKTATTADVADSTDKRYVTDDDLVILSHTSGTNTGDQDLSGLIHTNRAALDAVSGTNTGDQDLSEFRLKPAQEFIIARDNGDFDSIATAIDSITDAAIDKQYLLKLKAGTYVEPPFTMKPFISLVGEGGFYNVLLQASDMNNHFITGASNAEIINCAISGPTGTGFATINHETESTQPFILQNVAIKAGYYGIWCHPANARGVVHCLNVVNWYGGTVMEKFAHSTDYGNITGVSSGYMSGPNDKCQFGFCCEGPHAEMTLDLCFFRNSGTALHNTALHLDNGATVRTSALTISSAFNGIVCGNAGAGSHLTAMATVINDAVTNHITTLGAGDIVEFSGKSNRGAINISSNDAFTAVFSDATPGKEGQVIFGELWLGDETTSIPIRDYGIKSYSTGLVEGGEVSKDVAVPLRINFTSGSGYINNGTSVKLITWGNGFVDVLDNNPHQVVYIDSTGQATVTTIDIPYSDAIMLAMVDAGHGLITYISDHRILLNQFIPTMAEYLEEVIGPISVSGGVTSIYPDSYSQKQLEVTSGTFYLFHTPQQFVGGSPILLHINYRDGVGGWIHTSGITEVDTLMYDDGSGTLAEIPAGKYKKDLLFLLKTPTAEYYHYIYGQELFDSQGLAEAGNNPVAPTSHIKYALRLAGIVSQQGDDHITSIVNQLPKIGQSASGTTSVTDHGDLSGLMDDDHLQYYNQTRGDARYVQIGTVVSQDIKVPAVGTPTMVVTDDDFFRYTWSAGVVSGGDLTDNHDGTIDISAGETLLRESANGTARLYSMTFPASAGIVLVDEVTNYIYVDFNGGSAVIRQTLNSADFNCWNKCHLYTIVREDNLLAVLEGRHQNIDANRNTRKKAYETEGFKHVTGGTILGSDGLHFTVTPGAFYYALNKITHSSFNTAIEGNAINNVFECYFTSATGEGGWAHDFNLKELLTDKYDDGNGNMLDLTDGYYSTHWIYLMLDITAPRLVCIHGRGNYPTLIQAKAEGVPTDIPPAIAGAGALIGRICFSKNATSYEVVESAFSSTFSASGGARWGGIGGDITNQPDLQSALSTKITANTAITGATKTKITYDAHGLVTSGADATTADIADSSDKRYVSDTEKTAITHSNRTALDLVSGTNTGDQDLSGLLPKTATTADIADSANKRYVSDVQKSTIVHSNRTALDVVSGTNTGDQDLSGLMLKTATTADVADSTNKRYVSDTEKSGITHSNRTALDVVSGTNTGDQDLSGLMLKTATTADVVDSTNKRYVSDAEKTAISHSNRTSLDLVSGTNTGDQVISDATLSLSDTTVNNVSTEMHGLCPKVTDPNAFHKGDGTWAYPTAGAAGADTQIQFNDGGAALNGDPDFTWDKTTNTMALSGSDTGMNLTGITNEPASPTGSVIRLYSKAISGRMMPKWKAPSGVDTSFQANLGFNTVYLWTPATSTTAVGNGFGNTWPSCTGTISHPTPTTGMGGQMKVMQCTNSGTTTNQILGLTASTAALQSVWRGNAAGQGGFFFQCRFKIMLIPAATVRLFIGLSSLTTGVVAADTTTYDCCGFSHISTDSITQMAFMTRDNATTNRAVFTVPTLAVGNSYDATLYSQPNGSAIYYRLVDLLTGNVLIDTSTTTNLPRNTIFMGPQVQMSNGANAVSASTAIGINKMYLESDM